MTQPLKPARATHPADLIHDEMKARRWTMAKFQSATNLEWDLVAGVVQGATRINHHIAERLAEGFDTSVEVWLNLQSQYDEWLEVRHG